MRTGRTTDADRTHGAELQRQLSASGGNLCAYLKAGAGITTIVSGHPTKSVACEVGMKSVPTPLNF